MEQSLYQLQSELQIESSHERHSGGYLAYIKSKYQIEDKGDTDSIRKEWQLNFDCSQFQNHGNDSCLASNLKQQSSPPNEDVDSDEALEIVLVPNSRSDSKYDSPNLILFDNFIIDGSRDCSVDFGDYVPSGVKHSKLEGRSNRKYGSLNEVRSLSSNITLYSMT